MSLPSFARLSILWTLLQACAAAAPVEISLPDGQGAQQPQVAMTPGGKVHLVFGRGTTIYHTQSADGGRSFSPPVLVAEVPSLALGMRRGPRIAATEQMLTVSAISHTDGNILVWNSRDGGATWTKPQILNSAPKEAREGLHALAGNGQGLVAACWLDTRSNRGKELWCAVSQDGGASWNHDFQAYQSPDGSICPCCHPSIAVSERGRIALLWRNSLGGARDMYTVVSDDRGKTFAPPQKLGAGTWKLNACPMDGGGIAFPENGGPVSVWRREKTVFLTGNNGAEQKLESPASQPVAFLDRAGVSYLWQSDAGLTLQRAGAPPTLLAKAGLFPSAASSPGHPPIATWEEKHNGVSTIYAEALP